MKPEMPCDGYSRTPPRARLLGRSISRRLLAAGLMAASLLAGRVVSQEDAPLSEEFLEFLAEWETASGEWIDPAELGALMPEGNRQREGTHDEGDTDEDH